MALASKPTPTSTTDEALLYIRAHRSEQTPGQDEIDIRRLKRKIDLYVITFLTLCYMLNFLDKVLSNILGGLTSFAFQHVGSGAAMAGWRVMFLVLGILTILTGLLVAFYVPNTPMTASFLSPAEKLALLRHVQGNQTGISSPKNFHPSQILEACLDFQIWAVCAIVLLQSVGGGVITTYSAQLIRGFGFTSKEAALLNMPSGMINILSSLTCGLLTRHLTPSSLSTTLLTLPASLLASPITSRPTLLAGIYLVNFITGVQPLDFQ
ncbi:hypothetical protein PRZ48_010612 [Zasmidium cellare]|uniref:Uncharacterized protein n=1 Tax=Zasmidium cellare TaxID=395010 RepID=A0ABR0E957_ZASCE|nr:hypothetical protein PRZ48_010612 [Zasmidium cellare]